MINFKFVFVLIGLIAFENLQAQVVYVDLTSTAPEKSALFTFPALFSLPPSPQIPVALDSYLSAHIKGSFEYYAGIVQNGAVSCSSPRAYEYTVGLTVMGNYSGCVAYARNCVSEKYEKMSLPMALQGARCAALNFDYSVAKEFYDIIPDLTAYNGDIVSASTFEHAVMAMSSQYSDQVDLIINNHPRWTAEQKNLAKALVEVIVSGRSKSYSMNDVNQFINDEIEKSDGYYERYLLSVRLVVAYLEGDKTSAYKFLLADAIDLTNPLDWWLSGFKILYALSDGTNYSSVDNFYKASLPFLHSRFVGLPVERNIHTYTQIFDSICKDSTLQIPDRAEYDSALTAWMSGEKSISDTISFIESSALSKEKGFISKADVLSTLGSLYAITGNNEHAEALYWKAHQACPYYNRAHWGLALLERKHKYTSFPEYASNEKFVVDTISKIQFPDELNQFIANYDSFPEPSKNKIKFAARYWAGYMKPMLEFGSRAFIKLPFQKLSEVATFEELKDKRIGPPDLPNHKFDNRLWDDVRGAGGKNVAADHDEVSLAVHGDYNLLGHETAHSFHYFLEKQFPLVHDCLLKLYDNALKRDVFQNSYSKTNYKEYFAEGVTYYMVPENFPARYGLNQGWAKVNDPDLFQFLVSIEKSNGDGTKIQCPVSL